MRGRRARLWDRGRGRQGMTTDAPHGRTGGMTRRSLAPLRLDEGKRSRKRIRFPGDIRLATVDRFGERCDFLDVQMGEPRAVRREVVDVGREYASVRMDFVLQQLQRRLDRAMLPLGKRVGPYIV
jgi:hypothetical protein